MTSLYILDFVDNDGLRIEGRTGLVVFNARELQDQPGCLPLESIGGKLEAYYLDCLCAYEIRLRGAPQPLKTISFPPTVQCI